MIRDPKAFRSGTGEICTPVRIAANRRLLEARPASNLPCEDKGMPSRAARGLHELKGRTEIIPSMAARGQWKLGAIRCRGASWREQLDGNSAEDSRFLDKSSWPAHPSSTTTMWYAEFIM